jgi:hypothetical protein
VKMNSPPSLLHRLPFSASRRPLERQRGLPPSRSAAVAVHYHRRRPRIHSRPSISNWTIQIRSNTEEVSVNHSHPIFIKSDGSRYFTYRTGISQ